jgi:hypothetical protein
MGEQQVLQEAIYFGKLTDSSGGGDLLTGVLSAMGAVERLNPRWGRRGLGKRPGRGSATELGSRLALWA